MELTTASHAVSAKDAVAAHQDAGTDDLFGITELCRAFGISLRAIRFYEDKGLSCSLLPAWSTRISDEAVISSNSMP